MTPTYDKPLIVQYPLSGASIAAISATIPASIMTPSPAGKLPVCKILGVTGIVSTAGSGSITFGDGTDDDRYGTFTIKAGLAANAVLDGELTLTEEGFRIGLGKDGTVASTFVAKGVGAFMVLTSANLVVGYFY